METTLALTHHVRRILVALLLILPLGILAAGAVPANAAPSSADADTVLPVVLTSGREGPALPNGQLTVNVPLRSFADRQLLAGLDAGAEIAGMAVGDPTPQAGPYHDSTTWSWEICIWVSFPDGTVEEWCLGLTIVVSTDVEKPVDPPGAADLSIRPQELPFEVCWDEETDDGTVITHCIEITIDTGGSRDD